MEKDEAMGRDKEPRTIYEAFAAALKSKDEETEYWRSVAGVYEKAILTLARQIAETDKTAARWVPCAEALPEERRAVLVYAPLRKSIYMAYYDSAHGWMTFDPIFPEPFPVSVGVIAAWMKPPEPWKGDEE